LTAGSLGLTPDGADGRLVRAKLYPIYLMEDFRKHFYEIWLPKRMIDYFAERDKNALPYAEILVLEYQEQKVLPGPA
jgi:hypothetical protein